jgi:crotonobetainyl-CoA:carnitine CoA-transferase CaiB-like acyl-CoA transferase
VGRQPADAARRGIDFPTLVKANPQLVYCAITGYGEAGPWRDIAAHGLNADAFAGLVPTEWSDGIPLPSESYQSIGTSLAGVFAALGILAALRERDQFNGPRYVHCSMWEAAMWISWRNLTALANTAQPWRAYRNKGSRYAMYGTSDKRAVLLCPIERHFWIRFCDLIGAPDDWKSVGDWSSNGMYFGDGPEEAVEKRLIQQRIEDRPLTIWIELLKAAQIPYAPVLTIPEALGSEQASAAGVMRTERFAGHDVAIPSMPVRIVSQPGDGLLRPDTLPAPGLGEHTEQVLAEWGLKDISAQFGYLQPGGRQT